MNRKRYVILAVAALLVLLVPIVTVVARYYSENDYGGIFASSDKFYFTADFLDDGESSFECDITGGDSKVVSFKIKNYMDSYRYNDYATKYTISMKVDGNSTGVAPQLLDSSDNAVDASEKTLAAGATDHSYKLKLDSGYLDGAVVTVTVRSTAPYVREMNMIFRLHTYEHRVSYLVSDSAGSPYMELFVTSHYGAIDPGNLKIDWSEVNGSANMLQIEPWDYVLDPDFSLTTNAPVDGVNAKNGYLFSIVNTVKINMGETVVFRFYKVDSSLDYESELSSASGGSMLVGEDHIITLVK